MPRRDEAEAFRILERRKIVAADYLRGVSQWEIARKVGIDQSRISRDLKAIRAEWLASAVRDFDTAKAQELAKIDHMESEAWAGWERSCRVAEVRYAGTTKGRTDKDGGLLPDLIKTYKTKKGQSGDPRFLERVAWCIDRRCKILGFDAPIKVAPTNPDGTQEYAAITDADRLAALHRLYARLGQGAGGQVLNGQADRNGSPATGPGPVDDPSGDAP